MSSQSFLKQIFKQVIKQYDYKGTQSLKDDGELALKKIIQMKTQIADVKQMILILDSAKNLQELKLLWGYFISKQTHQRFKLFYKLKSVQLGWKNFLQNLNENKQASNSNLQIAIRSLILETLNLQLSKDNKQQNRQLTTYLINKYFRKMIDQIKNEGCQYCQKCTRLQIQYQNQKIEMNKIKESKDEIIKKYRKQLEQNKMQIQQLKKKQKQYRRYSMQSDIFVDEDVNQFNEIDKGVSKINNNMNSFLDIIQNNYIQESTQTQKVTQNQREIQVKIQKSCFQEQIQTEKVWVRQIVQQKSIEVQIGEAVKLKQQIGIQTNSISQIIKGIQIQNMKGKQSIEVETESIQEVFKERQIKLREQFSKYRLFCGQIFQFQDIHKLRLINHIQSKGNHKISSTHLLYRYDPINKQNFHQYIDNIQGLAFIVKTIKGVNLCGYYSGKLVKNQILNAFGLIINLNNDQSYEIKQEPHSNRVIKSMIYDDFYCIFGNAELRIKAWENFVFSNFGVIGGYFNNRGAKIHDFLGEGNQRQAFFQTYQFFQVKLEKKQEK